MKLNEKIYWCRKKAGLSQEGLAEVIGVSRQSISKWENGEAAPEITKLPLLAKAFGVTADWLLSEDGIPDEEPASAPAPQTPETESESQVEAGSSWPDWVENLPGFISRAVKQYGWLYGVRTAISGAVMAAFGVMMRVLTGSFFNTVSDMGMVDPFFGGSTGGMTWYDEAGNIIDAPSYAGEFMDAMGISGGSTSFTSTASGPFDVMSGFVIFLGVATMIGGIVLAVLLKKWGEKEAKQ